MNKKLKSIEVGLIGCSGAVTLNASDTATEPIATYALDEFKAEKQMNFKDNGTEYYVPFHAVDHIVVNETEESTADRPNPYGCEGGSDTKRQLWATATMPASGWIQPDGTIEEDSGFTFIELNYSMWKDIFINHQNYVVEGERNGVTLPLTFRGTDEMEWIVETEEVDALLVFEDGDDNPVNVNVSSGSGTTNIYVTKK